MGWGNWSGFEDMKQLRTMDAICSFRNYKFKFSGVGWTYKTAKRLKNGLEMLNDVQSKQSTIRSSLKKSKLKP